MSPTDTLTPASETRSATDTLALLRCLAHLRWLEADSSAVAAIAYDSERSTLYTQMRGGQDRIYAYGDVPESEFVALATAPSIGSYFARNIRNAYSTERIDFALRAVS